MIAPAEAPLLTSHEQIFEAFSEYLGKERGLAMRSTVRHLPFIRLLQNADKSYLDEGVQLLELARNAQRLFERLKEGASWGALDLALKASGLDQAKVSRSSCLSAMCTVPGTPVPGTGNTTPIPGTPVPGTGPPPIDLPPSMFRIGR